MKYECQRCGACCRPDWFPGAAYAAAIFRPDDVVRAAGHLGISAEECEAKYEIKKGHVRVVEKPCTFQDADGACTVYDVKPDLCTAFPFKWGNVEDPPENLIKFAAMCPGITLEHDDHKKIYAEIERIKQEARDMAKNKIDTPAGPPEPLCQ
ncbi:MAG: YkgJ family cysteine cluster protein [bacterium]|nr:YkgJ family cysteine cluster protein [bacterium]